MPTAIITHPIVPSPIRHPKLSEVTSYPRPRYKGHWAIGTRHLEESNRFYETLASTQLICRPASFSTAISWDLEHHRFFIIDLSGAKKDPSTGKTIELSKETPQERTGVGLASIRYASPQALVRVYRKLEQAGWKPTRIVDCGAMLSLIYKDPNDLLVEAFAANAGVTAQEETELTPEAFLDRFG